MAAYDRAAVDKTLVAQLLKFDDTNRDTRMLLDCIAKILNKNYATIQADSVATLVTALGVAGV